MIWLFSILLTLQPLIFFASAESPPNGVGVMAPTGIPAGPDTFHCGNYLLSGILKANDLDAEVLELYPGTSRKFDLVVRGISLADQTTLVSQPVSLEVYVYKEGKGGEAISRMLGGAKVISPQQALEKPIIFQKRRECFEKK